MPTFRRAQAIGATIKTLLDGTWTDFELLVRDDGDGNDGTREAVAAAANGDTRVRYHRNERNLGMPGNLNKGIEESRGEFIAVCHDHDLYQPTFIETMAKTLCRHPTALFVHCAIQSISQNDALGRSHIGEWAELTPGPEWLRFMLSSLHCPVCALTLVKREAHERYGLYDPACEFIADVEMWMRLSSHGDVVYVKEPLIRVREREEGHIETLNGERWIRVAANIHRDFLKRSYGSSQRIPRRLILELSLAKQYLRYKTSRVVAKMFGNSRTRSSGHMCQVASSATQDRSQNR
jgi:glycosyltransferase involved in cell wall biosynthesis